MFVSVLFFLSAMLASICLSSPLLPLIVELTLFYASRLDLFCNTSNKRLYPILAGKKDGHTGRYGPLLLFIRVFFRSGFFCLPNAIQIVAS